MSTEKLKSVFAEIAKKNGFDEISSAWFKESGEAIVVLDLQKSNFGNSYYLNIKIYIQGMFGNTYSKTNELISNTGDIFRREPKNFEDVFDLNNSIEDTVRATKLESLFKEFLVPLVNKALSKDGLRDLFDGKEIHILPAVKEQLGF